MKISKKVLSIPPHISTTWDFVQSIGVETINNQKCLVIDLETGKQAHVPNLSEEEIKQIFDMHATYLEEETEYVAEQPQEEFKQMAGSVDPNSMMSFGIPLNLQGELGQGFSSAMQHNPDQANGPDMPKELLEKLSGVAKVLGLDSNAMDAGMGEAEPHCNCTHCQIVRAIAGKEPIGSQDEEQEEIVSDEDLKFREWDIIQKEDQLYVVTNPLDNKEHYQVYLGKPICCTCGKTDCEHIKAVLRT
ncbi:MAG: hypothetical protein S4CHLAM102_02920 [Chlamydiia bacterium]|nr:hypothetical protein [Chlamydiia bacterium]